MSFDRRAAVAQWVNTFAPGVGLILLRRVWMGLIVSALFTLFANVVVLAVFLLPDEFNAWTAGLSIGLTGGTYVGAQVRLVMVVREARRKRAAEKRRRVLGRVLELMRDGEARAALRELSVLEHLWETDLLVAYRVAQLLSAAADEEAGARRAWQRVRRLDKHRIYGEETRRLAEDAEMKVRD